MRGEVGASVTWEGGSQFVDAETFSLAWCGEKSRVEWYWGSLSQVSPGAGSQVSKGTASRQTGSSYESSKRGGCGGPHWGYYLGRARSSRDLLF